MKKLWIFVSGFLWACVACGVYAQTLVPLGMDASTGKYRASTSGDTFAYMPTQVAADWNEATTSAADYIKNKPSLPVNTPVIYSGATLRTNPVEYTSTGTTSSGTVVFQLTTNGISTGPADFPNNIDYMKAEVSDSTNSYNYAYVLSNSNKTLTVTVSRSAPTGVISLLGISVLGAPVATPNGTSVNIFVKGN